jgi:hypothetical protein
MTQPKCPGQETRFWKREDVSEIACPDCGKNVEFFKDEVRRKCRCGLLLVNPKVDLACAEWCESAEKCLGTPPRRRRKV